MRNLVHPRLAPKMAIRLASLTALASALAFGSTPAWALPQDATDAQIEDDLEFALGLASQWGFVDIAEGVLADLEGQSLSERQQDRSALVRAELYSQSARLTTEPVQRREQYDRAIEEYQTFISDRENSPLREEAEASLVSAAFTYSQYLGRDIEEAVGEEVVQLQERQTKVLTETISMTGDSVDSLLGIPTEERTAQQTSQLYNLMLQRAQMLAILAKSSEDKDTYYTMAMNSLEEMAGEAGDGTPASFFAFDAMGDIFSDQGKWEDATAFYDSVLESTIPYSTEDWDAMKEELELVAADVQLYMKFVQLSAGGSIQAYEEMGDMETSVERAMYLINNWKREGVALDRNGQESLLTAGRALLASSGFVGGNIQKGEGVWYPSEDAMKEAGVSRRDRIDTTSFAIELASEVNDTSAFGYLRNRARRLLADIAETPGIEVSPELQLEGLLGEYKSGNYDEAINKAHRLTARLLAGDEGKKLEIMPTVCNILGNVYLRQERKLESAMAFREGVATYAGGDLAKDASSAKSFNRLMTQLVESSDTSNPLYSLVSESESLVSKHAVDSAGGIAFNTAKKLHDQKEYELAIPKFEAITIEDEYGELALAYIGRCHVQLKQLDKAVTVFERYINEVLTNVELDSESPRRVGNRVQAKSISEFYLAYCYHKQKKYDDAIQLLAGYHERFREQTSLARSALSLKMQGHLALGDPKAARESLESLEEFAPDSGVTKRASTSFYLKLRDMWEKEEAAEKKIALLREMAERLETANSVGQASYANLWNENDHWYELGENEKSLTALKKLYERFLGDEEQGDKVNKFVIPRMAEIMLAKKEVVAVSELLTPLAQAELDSEGANRLPRSTSMLWIQTLTGWVEGGENGKPVVQVPGTGGSPELFQLASEKLENYSKSSGTKSYSCAWFEIKFALAYTYYQWGETDSSKRDSVSKQLKAISASMSNDKWDDIDQQCDKAKDEALKARTTGHALRNQYRWLAERVN